MLSLMRRNAGNWIIKIILFIIVIVFMFWGVGSYSEMRRNRVATVGDYTITMRDFDATYRSMLQQAQNELGSEMTEGRLKEMQLEKQALTQLINRELVLQAAAKLKLAVSDEEVRNRIYTSWEFQNEEGQFDAQRYQAILNHMQTSSEGYETMLRDDLLINKLSDLVLSDIKVSDVEVEEWFQQINRRVAAKYAELNPAVYLVTVSDEEMQAYYDAHIQDYMTRPMRQVAYACFAPEDYMEALEVTDDELMEIYESNIDLYSTPDMLDISQIVIAIERPGDAASEEAAKAKAEEAYNKLTNGADFADMVKEYSELIFQQNEGRAFNLPKQDFVEYFGEEMAGLNTGELTPPLKTDFAWYIFKFNEVKPAQVQAFEDVKDTLKAELSLNDARNAAYDDAEEVSAAVFGGEELEAAAGAKDVEVVTTEYFDRSMLVNSLNLLQRSDFNDFVFAYEVGDVSEPHEFEGDYYVVVILDEKAPERIPLEDVKVVVEQAVRAEKQMARALEDARKIIADVKTGKTIEEAAAPFDATVKYTGLVTRYDYVMDFDTPGGLAFDALFSLSEAKPVIDEPLPGPMVLVYESAAAASTENYDQESVGIKMELLQTKRNVAFDKYLKSLKQNTKIWVAEHFAQYYDAGM